VKNTRPLTFDGCFFYFATFKFLISAAPAVTTAFPAFSGARAPPGLGRCAARQGRREAPRRRVSKVVAVIKARGGGLLAAAEESQCVGFV